MTRLSFFFACSLALACGKSTTGGTDTGITFDATFPDTGPDVGFDADIDGGPGESDIGEACSGETCDEFCIEDWPAGYCTAACGGGAECTADAECVNVGRDQFLCLQSCDPAAERPCREGYGCTSDIRFGTVCIPGCTVNEDCPMGLACNADGGFAGEGACYDPEAELGDACGDDDECPDGGYCLAERFSSWPGGACIGFGCDVESDTGCDSDARCIPGMGGGGLCIDGCTVDSDCREGFGCRPYDEYPDRRVCLPACTTDAQCSGGRVCNPAVGTCADPFEPSELGTICSGGAGGCDGGSCLTEFETGFPGSYCVYVGCDATMPDATDGCPGDGVCAERGDGPGVCLDGCADDRDCRAPDYSCRDVDDMDPAKGKGCFPSCTTDDACANDGTMGRPSFMCNPGTGLCTEPFAAARVGAMCAVSEDCPGGRCLSEAERGWPAGTCAALGCRLAGEGPASACPATSVCVDDATGDPEIGICLSACTVATSGCRAGYACIALTEGDTEGACRPACEAGSCSGGRTCDTETGLCGA